MTSGKWTYNYEIGDESWDCEEEFDTIDEAINAARSGAIEYAKDYLFEDEREEYLNNGKFEIGQIKAVTYYIDGESIIEKICEQFYEQCGEACEGWLEEPRNPMWPKEEEIEKLIEKRKKYREQIEDLDNRLHDTFDKWLTDTNNQPYFFSIENTQTVLVNPESN